MEGWMWALVLKPFGLLFFLFGAGVIALCIKPLFPNGSVKNLLYDKTFRDRRPGVVYLLIFGFYVVFIGTISIIQSYKW